MLCLRDNIGYCCGVQPTEYADAGDRPTAAEQRVRAVLADQRRVVNTAHIDIAQRDRGWSRARLAAEMGRDRTHLTNVLNGHATGGWEIRASLWEQFQNFRVEVLFPLPAVLGEEQGDAA